MRCEDNVSSFSTSSLMVACQRAFRYRADMSLNPSIIVLDTHRRLELQPSESVVIITRVTSCNATVDSSLINKAYPKIAQMFYENARAMRSPRHAQHGELKEKLDAVRPEASFPRRANAPRRRARLALQQNRCWAGCDRPSGRRLSTSVLKKMI